MFSYVEQYMMYRKALVIAGSAAGKLSTLPQHKLTGVVEELARSVAVEEKVKVRAKEIATKKKLEGGKQPARQGACHV
jgi:hypothetical protein